MKTKTTTFRLSLLLSALFLVVCGGQSPDLAADASDDLTDDGFSLSTTRDTFVQVRHDYRKCVSPLCGGYWVKDLNGNAAERYVNSLDFSATFLEGAELDAVTGASDYSVVLLGRLGAKEKAFKTRPFLVTQAFRALPGVEAAAGDQFYQVASNDVVCVVAPCANLDVSRLNRSAGHAVVSDVLLDSVTKTLVDGNWLANRITNSQALVAGRIIKRGKTKTLEVSQVFLGLPERTQSCPKVAVPQCGEGTVEAWYRNENRCLIPEGCVEPRFCAAYVPSCDEGYSLVSWQNACTAYACEPSFLQ